MRVRFNVARQPRVVVVASFVLILALIVTRSWMAPYDAELAAGSHMPLGQAIDSIFAGQPIIQFILGIAIAVLCATIAARLIDRYGVSLVPTFLPLMVYVMAALAILTPFRSLSASIVSLLLMLSTEQMIAGFRRNYSFENVFNSAFCLGIIPLLYPAISPLILILPVTLSIYHRTLRETAVAVVGLLLPFMLCSAGWWVAGYTWGYIAGELWEGVTSPGTATLARSAGQLGLQAVIYAGAYAALILYSAILIVARLSKMPTRVKKIYTHILILLAMCAAGLFVPSAGLASLTAAAIPCAIIPTMFFSRHQGWFSLLVYLVLIILLAVVNIIRLIHLG